MEAETKEGDYHWTVTGIEKPKTATPIYFLDRNYVKTSRENTRKQERLLLKDPAGYLESYGYNFTTTNFNGQVVKLSLFTFDNPWNENDKTPTYLTIVYRLIVYKQ